VFLEATVNFRQGFLRLWIVGSVVFAGGVGVLGYEKVAREFERAGQVWPGTLLVPVDCRDARGTAKEDYTTGLDGPWCWYQIDVLRRLYPEYKDLSDDTVGDRLYKRANIATNPAAPWKALRNMLLIAFGVPALALLLGAALAWVLAGFAARRSPPT
jgi:hypothetical protein